MPISQITKDRWDSRIAIALERDHLLNDWELEFVESLELQRSHGKILSLAQVEHLYEIFEKVGG